MSGQEDYVLVPREPTKAMNEAGCIAAMECRIRESKALKAVVEKLGGAPAFMSQQGAEAWRAMLSAAPASPQPQGADGINAGSVETPGSTLGLSAEACQRSGAAGLDSLTSETLGEYKYQKPSNASVLGPITHPQPSGDGALQNALDEGARLYPAGPYSTSFSADALKHAFGLLQPAPTDEWRRAVEACARVADQVWQTVKIGDGEYGGGIMNAAKRIAAAIRALSPTKPGAPPHTKEGE